MTAKFLIGFVNILSPLLCLVQNEDYSKSKQLNEVTVTAQSTFRNENGHLVVIPDRRQKKHSFNGYDLLSNLMIPGVRVNLSTGEVYAIFGSATLYI